MRDSVGLAGSSLYTSALPKKLTMLHLRILATIDVVIKDIQDELLSRFCCTIIHEGLHFVARYECTVTAVEECGEETML